MVQEDLAAGQLRFLHAGSVQDDPTRVIRAARYAARLGFQLAMESSEQIRSTMQMWPWAWRQGDAALAAPPALATRLRMELERLLEREPWPQALDLLEQWQALPLLDANFRTIQGARSGCAGPDVWVSPYACCFCWEQRTLQVALAQRLQIPGKQQQWLQQCGALCDWLVDASPPLEASPSIWSTALEQQGWQPEAVALAVTLRPPQWKCLLRWWGRWRADSGAANRA